MAARVARGVLWRFELAPKLEPCSSDCDDNDYALVYDRCAA